jgi:acyl carrier protein
MNTSIDDQIRSIFINTLELPLENFDLNLKRDDVESWDSIAHVSLVMSIEHVFQVKIRPQDATQLKSPRDFQEKVRGLLADRQDS